MRRYHAVFQHDGPGGYHEFSATDDEAAIGHAAGVARIYGELRSLAEITQRWPVELRRNVFVDS